MITVLHPQVIPIVKVLDRGLMPILIDDGSLPKLIVKTTKEMLLTAKVNGGFKIYPVPLTLSGKKTIGLISAFFDDEDEPLVIYTPLFKEEAIDSLVMLLQLEYLDIHFFDELDRELLGYTSKLKCPLITRDIIANCSLLEFDFELAKFAFDQMRTWFGQRSEEDDLLAITVEFEKSLMPDDIFLMDARPENHLFQGSKPFSFSQLERQDPGSFQERDIANLLSKLFSPQDIYMNPKGIGDGKEVADILVITNSDIIVVQAKDSPNIEDVIKNKIARKKSTAVKSLNKALSQVGGAVRYIRSMSPLKIILGNDLISIDVSSHNLHALIIVKELFDDEYSVYSPLILKLSTEIGISCIALDYPEMQTYMTRLDSKEAFFVAFDRVFSHGLESGMLPRLRIWSHRMNSTG